MSITALGKEELMLLGRCFTQHPQLALLYFHCCSTDPAACVYNNELLYGPGCNGTVERLINQLEVLKFKIVRIA